MIKRKLVIIIFSLNILILSLSAISICLSIILGIWEVVRVDTSFKIFITSILIAILGLLLSLGMSRKYVEEDLLP